MTGLQQSMPGPRSAVTGNPSNPEGLSMPPVSFVVIGLNEERMIAACLRSVMDCDHPQDKKEIIYVDSGSTDRTLEIVQSLPGVTVFHLNDQHPNAAKGRNVGWQAARGEFVQFLDGDMVMKHDWPKTAQAFMSERDDVACVFGQVREHVERMNIYSRVFDMIWRCEPGPTRTLGGAFLARRDLLEELGGFDESLRGGEEPELASRIRGTEKTIWCLPVPMVVHFSGISTFREYWRRMFTYGFNLAQGRQRTAGQSASTDAVTSLLKSAAVSWLPLGLLVAALLSRSWIPALMGLAIVAAFVSRVVVRERAGGRALSEGILYGLHLFVSKFAITYGQATGHLREKERK